MEISVEEEELILAHSFRGFKPWAPGSLVSGFTVRHIIMAEGHAKQSCSLHGRDEAERKDRKVLEIRHIYLMNIYIYL